MATTRIHHLDAHSVSRALDDLKAEVFAELARLGVIENELSDEQAPASTETTPADTASEESEDGGNADLTGPDEAEEPAPTPDPYTEGTESDPTRSDDDSSTTETPATESIEPEPETPVTTPTPEPVTPVEPAAPTEQQSDNSTESA